LHRKEKSSAGLWHYMDDWMSEEMQVNAVRKELMP